MTETVTLETADGHKIGKADVISSIDHYPDEILVALERPQIFQLHRVLRGRLIYRLTQHYIPLAENFRK